MHILSLPLPPHTRSGEVRAVHMSPRSACPLTYPPTRPPACLRARRYRWLLNGRRRTRKTVYSRLVNEEAGVTRLGLAGSSSYGWALAFPAQPLLVLLLTTRPVRFLFWPFVEPFWLYALCCGQPAPGKPRQWANPDLGKPGSPRAIIAQVLRVAFWALVGVCAARWKLFTLSGIPEIQKWIHARWWSNS